MKIITRQSRANEAPKRYIKHAEYMWNIRGKDNYLHIAKQLKLLPHPINPDDVDEITGSKVWTKTPACDHCGTDGHPVIVAVGSETAEGAYLCANCIGQIHEYAKQVGVNESALGERIKP